MPKVITINPPSEGNPPNVGDNSQVTIHKKDNEKVKWECTSDDWAVVFTDATPFDRYYYSPSPRNETAEITAAANPEVQYPYTVYVDGQSVDPIIIVDE